jgi:dUTP pyrophosphatase
MSVESDIIALCGRIKKLEETTKLNRTVYFKKLHPDAIPPKYQKDGDAGFDFCALVENNLGYIIVEPKSQICVRTGISCSIPEDYEIQIRPRSGLAFKYQITITNSPGTVDSSYTIPNEIMIIMYNLSDKKFSIKNGDRIAQGVLASVCKSNFIEVEEAREEDEARNRGGGLGSTGIS